MDFALSEQQEILKQFAKDFLNEKYKKKVIKELENGGGHSLEIWQEMAALGWMGLPFPEQYGGANMTFLDLAILLEEMGKACAVSPYYSNMIFGGLPVLYFGSEEQKQKYLPDIATGTIIFSLAFFEETAEFDSASIKSKAISNSGNWTVNGLKLFVPYGHIANYIICSAKTNNSKKAENNITLFIIDSKDPGVEIIPMETRTEKLSEIKLKNVVVPKHNILGDLHKGWNIIEKIFTVAAVAKCCESVGFAQKALDMTIEYAKARKQYGHPIASFQAIQHYAADMLTDVYGMRISAYRAAWTISNDLPCSREMAIARLWMLQASERIISQTHQIHGAIGITQDYDLHYYTRRLKAAQLNIPNLEYCQDVIFRNINK